MTSENWIPVVGFETLYEVSDAGRVRSLPRIIHRKDGRTAVTKARIMKPCKSAYGYRFVPLTVKEKRKQVAIHRLVAEAFIGPASGRHVNHIDFDKTNNAANNLEWVTPKQNTLHSIRSGRWKNLHKNGKILASKNPRRAKKLTATDVAEIRSACARGELQHVIAKRYGVLQGTVSKIKRGESWSNEVLHGSCITVVIAS